MLFYQLIICEEFEQLTYKFPTSTQQVPNKYPTSTQQVPNKYPTSTQQVPNKHPVKVAAKKVSYLLTLNQLVAKVNKLK